MLVKTQSGKEVNVSGDVSLSANKITYKDITLGEYDSSESAINAYSKLTCHSWNKETGLFEMPQA